MDIRMLTQATIDELFSWAVGSDPFEICGLLFSRNRYIITANRSANPTHDFLISHGDYIDACLLMGEKPWALVHSHPTKGARPSVKDCQLMDDLEACGQDLTMIIVGLDPREIRAYKKKQHVYECIMEYVPGRLHFEISTLENRVNFIQE